MEQHVVTYRTEDGVRRAYTTAYTPRQKVEMVASCLARYGYEAFARLQTADEAKRTGTQ